jgi:hypothetical protein
VATYRIGGRDRRAASEAERARVNVTRAIRSTLSRIEQHDKTVGGQLKASVRTGTFCLYEPVPGRATRWTVKLDAQAPTRLGDRRPFGR